MTTTDQRIATFLRDSLGKPDLGVEDSIFTVGEASSLFTLELVLFIEEELGVELDDDDLERENFETINALSALVERRS